MAAGHAWIKYCDKVVVYVDHGISSGMRKGIGAARQYGRPVHYRRLYPDPVSEPISQ